MSKGVGEEDERNIALALCTQSYAIPKDIYFLNLCGLESDDLDPGPGNDSNWLCLWVRNHL